MATRKRHSPEQVVRKLMAPDRLLAEGKDTAAACRELVVSEATYHRWRNQFGGLKAEDAKRLKDLERENATLKRLLAEAELEKVALKDGTSNAPPDVAPDAPNRVSPFIAGLLTPARCAAACTHRRATTSAS